MGKLRSLRGLHGGRCNDRMQDHPLIVCGIRQPESPPPPVEARRVAVVAKLLGMYFRLLSEAMISNVAAEELTHSAVKDCGTRVGARRRRGKASAALGTLGDA